MTRRLALGISILWIPLAFLFDGVTVLVLPIRLASAAPDPATTLGLISFVGLGAALAVQPIAGWASDRLRHRISRRAFLAGPVLPVVAGLWLLVGAQSLALIAIGYLVVQVAASALQAGQQTLIPEHVTPPAHGRAAGLKTMFDLGGAFLAFATLGVLLSSGDAFPATVAITILLVLAVALVVLLVPRAAQPSLDTRLPVTAAPPAGFARLVLARFLFLLGTYAIGRFLLLLIAERAGIDPARAADETGGLLAWFTLVTAVAAILVGRAVDRLGTTHTMRIGVVLSAAGIAALLPPAGLPGILLGGSIMSLGTAAFVVANWSATTRLVPPAGSGRLMGIANLGTGGAAACAGLLGPLIDWGGFMPAIVIAAAVTLGALAPLTVGPFARALQPETAGDST